jgi:TonB family protein
MPAITCANLILYTLHLAAIAAIGLGLPVMCGMVSPRARLFHYRLVLVLALVLPLAGTTASPVTPATPAWLRAVVQAEQGAPAVAGDAAQSRSADKVATGRGTPWVGRAVLGTIALGFLAQLAWVAVGLGSLRRLRRGAERLDPRPVPVREAVALASADADIKVSSEIACPVNFGALRPTVLLPRVVRTYPDEEQRAVTCHELIHVRRYDWLWTVGDEIVRAVFWFHPAVWWLLAEIHLAREQVVDQEVVRITGARRPYLEALVKLARPAARPALRPAPSFIRRAHLAQRVALLLREVHMSKSRVFGVLATSAGTVLVAGALAAWALPLQAAPADARIESEKSITRAAPQSGAAAPAQPQKTTREGQPKLLSRAKPVYPPEAKAQGIKGVVIVGGRVTTAGEVTDLKLLRSIPALDQAALDAARQFRFEPILSEKQVVISIPFTPEGGRSPEWFLRTPSAGEAGETPRKPQPKLLSKVEPVYPPQAKAQGLKGSVIVEGRVNTSGEVTEVKVLRSVSPVLDQAAIDAVKQYRFAPHPTEKTFIVAVPFPPR